MGNLFFTDRIYGVYKYKNETLSFNTGVLLLNLKRMREFNFTKKIENILNNGFIDTKYFLHDQAIMNQFFYDYIGNLAPEYNSRIKILILDIWLIIKNYARKGKYFPKILENIK